MTDNINLVDTAIEQNLEGELRYNHSRIIAHSEEIAFYRGSQREKEIANATFKRVCTIVMLEIDSYPFLLLLYR